MFVNSPQNDTASEAIDSEAGSRADSELEKLRKPTASSSRGSDRSSDDFADIRHGLLSINIVKAKIPQMDETSFITYVPILGAMALLFTCDIYYITVRVVQVKKYQQRTVSAVWQPSILYDSMVGDAVEANPETTSNDSETYEQEDEHEIGGLSNMDASFNLNLKESKQILKRDVLFKSKTTLKTSGIELRWDESFEYVLSEKEYDENKQEGIVPKVVIVQLLLKKKDQLGFRQSTIGIVNVPLADIIRSKHIHRQYTVLGAQGTTMTASLNWQSF